MCVCVCLFVRSNRDCIRIKCTHDDRNDDDDVDLHHELTIRAASVHTHMRVAHHADSSEFRIESLLMIAVTIRRVHTLTKCGHLRPLRRRKVLVNTRRISVRCD